MQLRMYVHTQQNKETNNASMQYTRANCNRMHSKNYRCALYPPNPAHTFSFPQASNSIPRNPQDSTNNQLVCSATIAVIIDLVMQQSDSVDKITRLAVTSGVLCIRNVYESNQHGEILLKIICGLEVQFT